MGWWCDGHYGSPFDNLIITHTEWKCLDEYKTFSELAAAYREGESFEVEWIERRSSVLVIAPHGGGIEPHTVAVAKAIARSDHSLYCFKGTRSIRQPIVLARGSDAMV